MSPVLNQPSSKTAADSWGIFQYPLKTEGPRTNSSPSSAMRTSTFGSGLPTVPRRWLMGLLTAITGEVSVSP